MLILVTAVGYQTNVSSGSYSAPVKVLINSFKIVSALPNKNGVTEVRLDEGGRNILLIKETPEELYELAKQE